MRNPTSKQQTGWAAAGALALLLALSMVTGAGAQSGEVVVYSARSQYGQEPAIDAFTRKTGIQVKSFGGNTSELFDRLKAEGDKTPADVLITVDAGNLWNAGRAGLLARMDSPQIAANVPANLRDPEGRWTALTVRARTIMYNTSKVKPEELSTYEALAIPSGRAASASAPRPTCTTSPSSPP
jgi:iron(III) transport system substrate-binding protein